MSIKIFQFIHKKQTTQDNWSKKPKISPKRCLFESETSLLIETTKNFTSCHVFPFQKKFRDVKNLKKKTQINFLAKSRESHKKISVSAAGERCWKKREKKCMRGWVQWTRSIFSPCTRNNRETKVGQQWACT